jgi:pyruvate/2-oxoglutarate dehydrogenase complex dihydrolipoamide dehydrogenase (E3) component
VQLPRGEVLRPEQVLVAAGRVGNTDGLGLEAMGVELDARKRIVVFPPMGSIRFQRLPWPA